VVGETLPPPNEVIRTRYPCQCSRPGPWPPRLRHFLRCPAFTVCQVCHTEGSYTAVGLVAVNFGKDDANFSFKLDVYRELGCGMDELEPDWKCHAQSPSTLADAQENWVRWMQLVKDKRRQWKISDEASTSTRPGFLETVNEILGTWQEWLALRYINLTRELADLVATQVVQSGVLDPHHIIQARSFKARNIPQCN
jgi:hypothetical protein